LTSHSHDLLEGSGDALACSQLIGRSLDSIECLLLPAEVFNQVV